MCNTIQQQRVICNTDLCKRHFISIFLKNCVRTFEIFSRTTLSVVVSPNTFKFIYLSLTVFTEVYLKLDSVCQAICVSLTWHCLRVFPHQWFCSIRSRHSIQLRWQEMLNVDNRRSCVSLINPLRAELNNLNFHRLEVVSRYSDPQYQVGENYPYCSISDQTFAHLDV